MMLAGILLSLLAGLSITLGGFLSSISFGEKRWVEQEIKHGIIAFGGGALLSAVALVLVVDGVKHQPPYSVLLTFFLGGLSMMALDYFLKKSGTQISQLIAMMMDFIPEAMVLGVVILEDFKKALFLAIIIAAQNLPEGYAAFLEMKDESDSQSHKKLLAKFLLIGISGPIYVLLGAFLLKDNHLTMGMMMTFCGGGILYLVFQDVAPKVPIENAWLPPMGAVLGFMVGMLGYMYT